LVVRAFEEGDRRVDQRFRNGKKKQQSWSQVALVVGPDPCKKKTYIRRGISVVNGVGKNKGIC